MNISLIAGDPFNTERDQLDEEADVIKKTFHDNKQSVDVSVIHEFSEKEVFAKIKSHNPEIVEFTGHGSPNKRIVMEDENGLIRRKTAGSFATNFQKNEIEPKCLLFNNCSVGNNTSRIRQNTDIFIQVQSEGVFDISLGFAQHFYTPLAKKNDLQGALDSALSVMHEEGVPIGNKTGLWHREAPPLYAAKADGFSEDSSYRISRSPKPSREPEPNLARKHTIWYATNRKPLTPFNYKTNFGPDYDDTMHYGKCDIAIPKYHVRGSTGTPFWKRWPLWNDDHLRVISIIDLSEDAFWKDLRLCIKRKEIEDKYILLFIHGYNVSFKQAAIRAAQLGADLNVTGETALFSWPSKGRVKSYIADEASVEASVKHLSKFLTQLSGRCGAKKIHIVAHSMGNRAFLSALKTLLTEVQKSTKLKFNQFFLAAPDIDVRVFRQLSDVYSKFSKRTTMYVSAKDKALWGSGILHEHDRAGYQPPVTIVNGIDTIEITDIDVSFLGHGYIAETKDLLFDMHSLMLTNTIPDKRFGLTSLVDLLTGSSYWKLCK